MHLTNRGGLGSPYTALYLVSCVGVKGDLVVAGDDELTTHRQQVKRKEGGHAIMHHGRQARCKRRRKTRQGEGGGREGRDVVLR